MKKNKSVTIKEIVEFGLEKIPEKQTITINLKDYIYIYRVLEEYMRFFHNPDHYNNIDDIKEFLGTISSGCGFEVLNTAVYKKMNKVKWPKEIEKMFEDGIFEHSSFPAYYNVKDEREE